MTTTFVLTGALGAIGGRAAPTSSTMSPIGAERLRQDYRLALPTDGAVTNRLMFKADASSPEQPFVNGVIWLLRRSDGYKAWEGYSDSEGKYSANGLERGVEYISVGIDPYRTHQATGAGPVIAMKLD